MTCGVTILVPLSIVTAGDLATIATHTSAVPASSFTL